MTDDTEFVAEQPEPSASEDPSAAKELSFFSRDVPPNTVLVKLWSGGHLSWKSESSAPVLALIMLMVLCLLLLILAFLSHWIGDKLEGIFQILGNAISAVVGAVVGSSASSSQRKG